MAKFTKDSQPEGRGRPKGSKAKRVKLSDTLTAEAVKQLQVAVFNGEAWAIESVLKRVSPTLKPVTLESSLDGEFLKLKMKEISEFEERLKLLEARNEKH